MLRQAIRHLARRFLRNRVSTIRYGPARGLKRKGALGLGGRSAAASAEDRFLESLDLAGGTVFDVGAAEGLLTLFFARAVGPLGQVVTFEPHPENRRRTVENVALNGFGNVRVLELALGEGPGRATLVVSRFSIGSGSLDAGIQSDLRRCAGTREIEVDVASLDHAMTSLALPPPSFVKIDVEGLEHAVLLGMRDTLARHRPALLIEMHGSDAAAKRDNARRVLAFLIGAGYSLRHIETDRAMGPEDVDAAGSGHIYGVHSARP